MGMDHTHAPGVCMGESAWEISDKGSGGRERHGACVRHKKIVGLNLCPHDRNQEAKEARGALGRREATGGEAICRALGHGFSLLFSPGFQSFLPRPAALITFLGQTEQCGSHNISPMVGVTSADHKVQGRGIISGFFHNKEALLVCPFPWDPVIIKVMVCGSKKHISGNDIVRCVPREAALPNSLPAA